MLAEVRPGWPGPLMLSRAMPVCELSAVKRPALSSRPLISLLVSKVPVATSGSKRLSSVENTGLATNWLPYFRTVVGKTGILQHRRFSIGYLPENRRPCSEQAVALATSAAVQAYCAHGESVNTDTDGALGEAGLVVEQFAQAPVFAVAALKPPPGLAMLPAPLRKSRFMYSMRVLEVSVLSSMKPLASSCDELLRTG